jgi:hypothetical protein
MGFSILGTESIDAGAHGDRDAGRGQDRDKATRTPAYSKKRF